MTDTNERKNTPMTQYYYVRSSDGCDETFDVYRNDQHILSVPFWDEVAQAESDARLIVKLLATYDPGGS